LNDRNESNGKVCCGQEEMDDVFADMELLIVVSSVWLDGDSCGNADGDGSGDEAESEIELDGDGCDN